MGPKKRRWIGVGGTALIASCILVFVSLLTCRAEEKVRTSPLAGSWYPADKAELTKQLEDFLAKASPAPQEEGPIALVSPHAGYRFCGPTAAYGFKLVSGREFTRVIVLAPSHQARFKGVCVSSFDAYETPLGKVPVERAVSDELLQHTQFSRMEEIETREHAAEMQVPFLQMTVKNLKIVPLIVGQMGSDDYKTVAECIRKHVDDKTLVIASSDFTHYGSRFGFEPFKGKTGQKELIEKLDRDAITEIEAGRAKEFAVYIERTGATICGHEPIAILLELFPDARGKLLHYSSSAETAGGDYSECVQYASIALFRPRKEAGLTEEERKTLLAIARDTLRAELGGKGLPDGSGYALTPLLKELRGVFVTLKNRGELRGCIGYMEGIKPLWQAVVDNAVNASHDMRFLDNPITAKEEKDISIEISVLSPRTKVDRAEDITIGVHGVEIQKSGRRAVFLPQVAPEQGWDRETMLQHLCQKAGLRRDDWKTGATFLVFTAEVFGEQEHK